MSQKDIRVVAKTSLRREPESKTVQTVRKACQVQIGKFKQNPPTRAQTLPEAPTEESIEAGKTQQIPKQPNQAPITALEIWIDGKDKSRVVAVSVNDAQNIVLLASAEEVEKGEPAEVWAVKLDSFWQRYAREVPVVKAAKA